MTTAPLPPLGFGLGLRVDHYEDLLRGPAGVDWLEALTENYLVPGGKPRDYLRRLREHYPMALHGVSLSIGSSDPLNMEYLQQLKALAEVVQPAWISDHLCWTGVAHISTHDLLPLPLTMESLEHVAARVHWVQDFLQRPLILENPSTYMEFAASTLHEWEFLSELVKRTGCGLLLDVNNVFVSGHNHGFDPEMYLRNIPHHAVVQIHVAGPTDSGALLIDTHDQPVPSDVWRLYRLAQQLTGGVSTLLEWDANIPEYPDLVKEVEKAKKVMLGEMPEVPVFKAGQAEVVSNPLDHQLQAQHG